MALLIRVEDVNHTMVERFGDEDGAFFRLCERARADPGGGWRVLDIVDRWSDTMLNRIQQERFLVELAEVGRRPDLLGDAGPMLERIRAAAEHVWEEGGYLTFVGD